MGKTKTRMDLAGDTPVTYGKGPLPYPRDWRERAEVLKASADLLMRTRMEKLQALAKWTPDQPKIESRWDDSHTVAFMLAGYALENVYKGIMFTKTPQDIRRIGEIFKDPKCQGGHDLIWLAEQAGLTLSADEAKTLEILTEHSLWAGRYPCPKNFEQVSYNLVVSTIDKAYARAIEEYEKSRPIWAEKAKKGLDADGIPIG